MLLFLVMLLHKTPPIHLIYGMGLRDYQIVNLQRQGRTGESDLAVLHYRDLCDPKRTVTVTATVKKFETKGRIHYYTGTGTLTDGIVRAQLVNFRLEVKPDDKISFRVWGKGHVHIKNYDEPVEKKAD